MKLIFSVFVAILFSLALACGSDTGNSEDGGLSSEDVAPGDMTGMFGEDCTQDSDCMENTCRLFNQLGTVCTQLCTGDTDCPSGTMGQKCNMMGFCRP